MRILGQKRASARIRKITTPDARRAISKALFEGGNQFQVAAQNLITSGSAFGKGHVPSKPGEAPNADTGHLDGSIETTRPEPLTVLVTSNAKYSLALELGTSKMEARPFMRPAVAKEKPRVVQHVGRAISRAVKG